MKYSTKTELIYEIFLKTLPFENRLDFILTESSTKFLIVEELEQSDINKLQTAVKDSIEAMTHNINSVQRDGLNSVASYYMEIKDALVKAGGFLSKLNLEDSEGVIDAVKNFFGKKLSVPRATQAIIDIQTKANTASVTLGNAIELLRQELEGKLHDDQRLSDIGEDTGLTPDDIRSGIRKAFKQSKPGGLWESWLVFLGLLLLRKFLVLKK